MWNRTGILVGMMSLGIVVAPAVAVAQQVQPDQIGVVQAPSAGSLSVSAPPDILHSAEVAMKKYDGGATILSSSLDKDDILGIWEVKGRLSGGRLIEADVRPDGTIEELEIEIGEGQIPSVVQEALKNFGAGFTAGSDRPRIEKSVRPSAIGLPEIWYEFSGTSFDVEIRSDGKAVFIEPA